MRKAIVTAAVLLSANFGALAADVVEAPDEVIEAPVEVNPERFGWTGIYLGASGGHAWLRDKDDGPLLVGAIPAGFRDEGNNWVYGGHAGFLYQFNNGFVAGAELEHLQLGIKFKNLGKLFDAFGLPGDVVAESATTLRLRGGFAYDRVLFTGHAGAGYVKTSLPAGLGVPTELADWGINVGAGIDYALTDNLTAGLQYSHYRFEEFDDTKIDAQVDTLTARVGYKF